MSTPRTNPVSTEVSSDAEWIWRASAEVVLPTAVAAGAGRPDSSAGLAAASTDCRPVSGYDGKSLFVTRRNVLSLLARLPGSDRAGQVTRHLAQARAALEPAPPPSAAPHGQEATAGAAWTRSPPPRFWPASTLWSMPAASTCETPLPACRDRRSAGPVASPHDQRAGGQAESVVWSRTRSLR